MTEQFNRYSVELRSVPGFYEQYSPTVDVWAEDDTQAIEQAFKELQRGAFPDRDRSMWRVLSVTRKGA
jgi:hypothetical protein